MFGGGIEMEDRSVKEMWERYLESIGKSGDNAEFTYTSWYFSDNESSADSLAELVRQGTKRATASLLYSYEAEKEPMPRAGEYSVITDWKGKARCVIRTKKITVLPFEEVTEEMARTEGEGDKSLGYWRRVHVEFFEREMKGFGKEFTPDLKVVFEEFEAVYVPPETY